MMCLTKLAPLSTSFVGASPPWRPTVGVEDDLVEFLLRGVFVADILYGWQLQQPITAGYPLSFARPIRASYAV